MVIVAPAAKNSASKNHPKTFYATKSPLQNSISPSYIDAFKTRKHLQMAGY